jgi:hypothetical protein
MTSQRNMNEGFIHLHVNKFDPSVRHKGLDVIVDNNSAHLPQMSLEVYNYNIIQGNSSVSGSDFPRGKIEVLYDTVISKYFESQKKTDLILNLKQMDESDKPVVIPINGEIIKDLIYTNGKESVRLYEENPAQEVSDIINKMITLKSVAAIQLKEQILKCSNQLRIGTLDMPKGTTQLVVHTADGVVPAPDRITRKQLIATLWFITSQYMNAPSFRKHLNLKIEQGNYELGYTNGEAYFKTEGLTDLEKAIAEDLMLIARIDN